MAKQRQQTTYSVVIRPAAKRELKKLKNNKLVKASIDATISGLRANPRPNGVEHLDGKVHRVRDGDYRIIYEIDDAARRVDVTRVRDRKNVYKH